MRTDQFGIPIYSSTDIFELLYQGNVSALEKLLVDPADPEIQAFNKSAEAQSEQTLSEYSSLDMSVNDFDALMQSNWLMPEDYKTLDIEQWVKEQTPPWDPEATRVNEELKAFKERDMLNLLRWLKYFVDTCNKNNVVWGVGRGSSVASYVLYLIGVHKIDSIKYNLDWQEFLR